MIQMAKRLEKVDLSDIRKMFEEVGENDINLGIGEPDFNIPENVMKSIIHGLNEGFTHYTSNMGCIELREEISKKLKKDNSLNFDSKSIMVTTGASEALYIASQSLFNKNDEVLIPDPGFLSYKASIELAEAKPIPIKTSFENDYKMKYEDVYDKINSKTKGIILNSPSNPTGAVMDKEDIKAICDLSIDHDFIIISDEIYEKIIYNGKHYSPAKFSENTLLINGFSKAYAMTGLRIGYIAGQSNIIDEILKVHQYNTACVSSLSQIGAYEALKNSNKYVENLVKEFRRRKNLILTGLDDLGLKYNNVQGAFYVFPKIENANDYVKKALKAGVVLVPGKNFGESCENNIRISYATSYENLKEAINRLKTINL
ncbi:MAG: pyridoxal phosphate-dependent aminotransferase [Methanobrevibacter sp.]|jgi:aspartate aminotransferase|nr:pyridoxal phosphate-dependent aminotransferase [Methanobrevibacter sp.]